MTCQSKAAARQAVSHTQTHVRTHMHHQQPDSGNGVSLGGALTFIRLDLYSIPSDTLLV